MSRRNGQQAKQSGEQGKDLGRALRVTNLVTAATVMQVMDLALTLTFMTTAGMEELNPIALRIAQDLGSLGLVTFKLGCMAVMAGGLLWVRHRASAELGAWVCVAVLTMLCVHWVDQIGMVASELAPVPAEGERWVRLGGA